MPKKVVKSFFQSNSRTTRLMAFFVVALTFVVLAQSLRYMGTAGRRPVTGTSSHVTIPYNYSDNDIFELADNWRIIPNVTANDILNKRFEYHDFLSYAYIDGAHISEQFGWNEVGDGIWHVNEASEAEWDIYNGYLYSVYATTIQFPYGTTSSFYLSFPDVNGEYCVFGNGKLLLNTNRHAQDKIFDYSGGYNSFEIKPDYQGKVEIMVAIKANTGVPNPGINGTVLLSTFDRVSRVSTISAIWYAIQIALCVLYIVGGAILLKVFENKASYFFLIALQIGLIVYYAIDNRFIPLSDINRFYSKHNLLFIIGILSYTIISSLFPHKEIKKRHPILMVDHFLPVLLIVLIVISRYFIDYSSYPLYVVISEFIFTIIINGLNIVRVLSSTSERNVYHLSLVSTLTSFFCMIHMIQGDSTLFSIKIYTYYIIVSFIAFILFFTFRYVQQSIVIKSTSERLQIMVDEKTAHITEINKNLTETNKMLIENEEARKNVLSNVSHDLRTPITAIRGYAELLMSARKNMSDEQVDNYLNNIHRRSVQMERIVSDIVELTRMESNTNEFNFTEVSISELLDEVVMIYEGDLRGTSKKLTLDIPENDFLFVNADPKKIGRVFENLISNSINYSFEEALIKIKAWRENNNIHVTVADNGIGIPEEEVNKVFDRFYRAKNSGQNIKGTGLGLSIVKTIIDHHDADITVESTLGSGTTFHIVMKANPI